MSLPGFSVEIQQKIISSKVLVIGAGGLGCPVIANLCGAGVGFIGIVDFDEVDISNLHRQFLYSDADIGRYKVEVILEKTGAQYPWINIKGFPVKFNAENADKIIADYDIVVDCTDDMETRYLINNVCVRLGKIVVYGAVSQFEGQVAVFNFPLENGRSASYHDLFAPGLPLHDQSTCNESGVLGTLASVIGSLQANEVIKLISGTGQPFIDGIYLINLLDGKSSFFKIQK